MSEPLSVQIKHVEAPTNFYIRLNSDNLKRNLRQIEKQIAKHAGIERTRKPPAIGSVVAYLHLQWATWVRVKIISIEKTGWFKVFLMDYGYFMFNADISLFCELPENLREESLIVKRASLVLKPIITESNSQSTAPEVAKYWSQEAITLMKSFEFTDDGREFYFEVYGKHSDGTLMGDVTVKSPYDAAYSISEKLIEQKWAIRDEKGFKPKTDQSLLKLPDKPIANFTKIFAAFFPHHKEKERISPSKETIQVPAGIDVGKYESEKLHRPQPSQKETALVSSLSLTRAPAAKPARTLPSSRAAVPSHSPKASCAEETPYGMVVVGEQIRPPYHSIQNTPFSGRIKEILKQTSNIQKYSWPQIKHGGSMIIVGDAARSEPFNDYLPAILDLVQSNRSTEIDGSGPVVVIIAKSKSYGTRIIKAIQVAIGIRVVEALGVTSRTVELLNGCDVLVTTPPAFGRIIEKDANLLSQLFNKKRMKHLIFDGIDMMLEHFKSESEAVFRVCSNGRVNSESNPQIIVMANYWINGIEKQVRSLCNNVVICIDNPIEAAAYAKCKFSIANPSSSHIEKVDNIIEVLTDKVYKKQRTILLTNSKINMQSIAKLLKDNIPLLQASEENSEEMKRIWSDQKSGSFSVFLTYDSVLPNINLRYAQNLIHVDVPRSWNLFVKRFGVLMGEISNKSESKGEQFAIATRVYLDDENLDHFVEIINFIQTRKLAKVPEISLEYLTKIKQIKEQDKCERNVNICKSIYQLGECRQNNCQLRHIFTKADKSQLQLPKLASIKFNCLAVINPSSFIIKVQSYFADNQWISLKKQNSEIERILNEDLQNFLKGTDTTQKIKIAEPSGVYAVQYENQWTRCKVIDTKFASIVTAYLIDKGFSRPFKLESLRVLPAQFKMRPLACKLQVMNIIPFDKEEIWQPEETEKVERMMEKVKGFTLHCNVKLAVQDILFTDSFDAVDKIDGTIKLRLKSELKKGHVCGFDERIEQKLCSLVEEGHLMEKSLEEQEDSVLSDSTDAIDVSPSKVAKISWKELSLGDYYEVHVKHYKNPESFFVVPDISSKKYIQKSLNEIESSDVSEPLKKIDVGAICAVKDEGKTYRGKIMRLTDNELQLILLDRGDVINCQSSALFELPQDLQEKLPFQLIHCRMIGLRPKFNMKNWAPLQADAVHGLIKTFRNLKIFVTEKNQKCDDLSKLGMNSYDVVLIDATTGKHLDAVAVAKKFAEVDVVVKPIDEDSLSQSDSKSQSFTDEDEKNALLAKLFLSSCDDSGPSDEGFGDKTPDIETPKSKASVPKETKVSVSVESKSTSSEVQQPNVHDKLSYIFKQPKVEWRQNDIAIRLQINAVDCLEYGIRIKNTAVDVAIKYRDRFEKTTINLYCGIDVNHSSHELRGLNIIVLLLKLHPHIEWPRLTSNAERSQFIKFSGGDIIFAETEENHSISSHNYKSVAVPTGLEDSSDEAESLELSDDDI